MSNYNDIVSFSAIPDGEDPETGAVNRAAMVGSVSVDNALRFDNEIQSSSTLTNTNQHLYFLGCCCDFRRAVLVLNAIMIVLRLVIMVVAAIMVHYVSENLDEMEDTMEDDAVREQVDAAFKSGYVEAVEMILEVLYAVAIGFGVVGIYGALKFKQWGIITAMGFYVVCLLVTVVALDIIDTILYSLLLYAHVYMLKLMKAGVMTDENYHRIARCCGNRQM